MNPSARSYVAVVALVMSMVAAGACGTPGPAREAAEPADDRASLQLLLNDWFAGREVAGVVLGIATAEGQDVVTAGAAQVRPEVRMTADYRFRIGSVTKTFVAAVVLQLMAEGRLSLDERVADRLDVLPDQSPITVEHLLSHRTGIPHYAELPAFLQLVRADMRQGMRPEDVIALALAEKQLSAPGTAFEYSGTNYLVLGLLVEEVTGASLRDELRRRVLQPLALTMTDLPPARERPAHLATGYSTRWASYFDEPVVDTSGVPLTRIASASWAEGAMVSDVSDLLTWTRALYAGHVLPETTRSTMLTAGEGSSPYGLGTYRFDTPLGMAFGHGGDWFGFRTEIRYLPKPDVAVVAVANSDEADLDSLVDQALASIDAAASDGPPVLADLASPDASVRRNAALELGRGTPSEAVVAALAEALGADADAEVRAAAALALGFVGTADRPAAVEALEVAQHDDDADVRDAAHLALGHLQGGMP